MIDGPKVADFLFDRSFSAVKKHPVTNWLPEVLYLQKISYSLHLPNENV